MAIALRYAARSDVGLVRSNNQDSAYAGSHLLVVADGMGGHAGGDVASSLAIGELAPLDGESHGVDDALDHLAAAIRSAHRQLLLRVTEEPGLTGMGTTVTALLRAGSRFALAHIGDSRGYLLREGELVQITHDHTLVQTLVDDGRLTPEEADHHPQRSVLMRVLSDLVDDAEPDLSMREARVGDRYLLCSDGLSGVVSAETLAETLGAGKDPAETCDLLVQLALRSGAPDNVTCIVADIVEVGEDGDSSPSVVGAAAVRQVARTAPEGATPSAAERAAALRPVGPEPDHHEEEDGGRRLHAVGRGLAVAAVVAIIAGGVYGAWRWTQQQFFVAPSQGAVAIFRGLPQDLGPVSLSSLSEVAADVPVEGLPAYSRRRVEQKIIADDEADAHAIVDRLREQAEACRAAAQARLQPSPAPSASPSPSTSPGSTATGATPGATSGPTPSPTPSPTPGATSTPGPTTSPAPAPEDCGGVS